MGGRRRGEWGSEEGKWYQRARGVIINKRYSYAVSWETYVKGNIVSKTTARYIQNLLAATAATKTEDSEDSSDDTDAGREVLLPGYKNR